MYERYYGFTAQPFQLTPDSRFYFDSRAHARANAHLTFGLAQGEGFIVVTGEVGAGKTTLIQRLLDQLDRETYMVAHINTTQLSGEDLFRLAMAGFGLDAPDDSKSSLLLQFEDVLRDHRLSGRRSLLIIDEAQNLSLAALEELRMLSNLTEGGRASLQTLLAGQPQFRRMLASPDLDQLRQRVLASYHLGPLTRAETRRYVLHRLGTAGWQGRPSWHEAAFGVVHDHSGGIPRRINRLCSRVLLLGALEQSNEITAAMVQGTAEELAADLEGAGMPPTGQPAAPRNGADELAALTRRIDGLEAKLARRERVFQRLLDLLAVGSDAAR
ncbi:MAG: XrtA-associated ATPase [Rhodospirillales bacterium]|nr:XrtA-associated ATPase [Rhodospirillales bacterium]